MGDMFRGIGCLVFLAVVGGIALLAGIPTAVAWISYHVTISVK